MLISRKRSQLAKTAQIWLYRGWYLPSNGTIVNVVLRDLDHNFQGKQFFLYAFVINKMHKQRISTTDLLLLTRPAVELLLFFFVAIWRYANERTNERTSDANEQRNCWTELPVVAMRLEAEVCAAQDAINELWLKFGVKLNGHDSLAAGARALWRTPLTNREVRYRKE